MERRAAAAGRLLSLGMEEEGSRLAAAPRWLERGAPRSADWEGAVRGTVTKWEVVAVGAVPAKGLAVRAREGAEARAMEAVAREVMDSVCRSKV